ncbi:MAG TPA: FtsX-like permease family protein [Terriglobia bacterium]|nr:FtsX-like permease family protein [Terriglobia bacterium]
MLARIITRSLVRRRRRKLLSLAAIALGITAATVVATLALDVGDQVNRELRSFGANITVTPAADSLPVNVGGVDYRPAASGAFLRESDFPALKKIFWANNIVAFAPFLYVPASLDGRRVVVIGSWFDHDLPVGGSSPFRTGLRDLHPAWRVQGQWPDDQDTTSCLVGAGFARSAGLGVGSTLTLTAGAAVGPSASNIYSCRASGLVETGGAEDGQVIAPLASVQIFAGEPGRVRRLEVSALTKPEDDFARRDPKSMSPDELERWSCSPYVTSIAYQIEQAIPGSVAMPVYPVADTEGRILSRIGSLMLVLAISALATACLAVASMMLATVIERRAEIGLFQSLGASRARVAAVFLLEGSAIGLAGGAAGYLAGTLLAHRLGGIVFGSPAPAHGSLLPLVLLVALVVTWAGSAVPLAHGLKVSAAVALRD